MNNNNKNVYVPLHIHSFYSLLDGLPSPKDIVDRCIELCLPAVSITDHGNVAAMKSFYDYGVEHNIKSIIGIEAYICNQHASIKTNENNKRHHLIILAKNDQGIKNLIALVSEMNRPDYFYRKPRIHLEGIKPFANGNLIAMTACIGGELPFSLFRDFKKACLLSEHDRKNLSAIRAELKPNWKSIGVEIIKKHQDIFGKDNYYLEIQDRGMDIQTVVTECLRELGQDMNIPVIPTVDSHYCRPEDADDQRLLLCAQMHTTMAEQDKIRQAGGDTMDFMISDQYYIPSYEEMTKKFIEEELNNTLILANKINYSHIGEPFNIPKFTNNEMESLKYKSSEYLQYLCINGGKNKLNKLTKEKKLIYWNQLQKELSIIKEAKLSDYFLIVWDTCCFADKNNIPRGKGRGSGSGSLINYLIGITKIDPIKYGLYFSRFYNSSRNILPHFNLGKISFKSWLSDKFETLSNFNIDEHRKIVISHLKLQEKILTDDMIREIDWIDHNNSKMWLYIYNLLTQKCLDNPDNSHLAFGLGITDQLNNEKIINIHKEHISLPDIDIDIGVEFRDEIISYLKQRWGQAHVSQMITFGRLQGKAALKEVFRAKHDTVTHLMKVKAIKEGKNPDDINITPFDLCNEITQRIPDEAAIMDELQDIRKDENSEYSILNWAIDNIEQVNQAYKWYKPLFDQAIRLEGTKKSQSRHAAGVVISDKPIEEFLPLTYDPRTKDRVVGVEMHDAEAMGACKFDFLGVVALDKIYMIQDLINKNSEE